MTGVRQLFNVFREASKEQVPAPAALANLPSLFRLLFAISRTQTIALIVLQVLKGLIPASAAIVAKQIVDEVADQLEAGTSNMQEVTSLLAIGLGLALALVLIDVVSTLIQQMLQEKLIPDLNVRLARKAVDLEFEFFERPEYYDMLSQAQREVSSRPLLIIRQMTTLISNAVTLVGFTFILFVFSPWLTVILLATFIPSVMTQQIFSRSLFRLWRRNTPRMRLANYYRSLVTGIGAAVEVRIFQLGEEFIDRLSGILLEIQRKNISLVRSRSLTVGTLELLSVVVYWGAFAWIVSGALSGDRFTIGDLVLFSTIFLQMRGVLQGILSALQGLYEGGLFIDNLFSFLDLPARQTSRTDRDVTFPRPIVEGIRFEGVSFSYPESTNPALQNIDLVFHPGERIAMVGENGAGKTTLAKLIARLYEPSEGRITLDGVDLMDYDIDDYYRNLSTLNQGFVRYHLSAKDNIGFGDVHALDDMDRIQEASQLSGSNQFINKWPNEYKTVLGKMFEGSTQISAGQWQRLALARAYMADSQILILDEPTSSLDVPTEAKMVEQYIQLAIGQIAIMITHRFSTVRKAHRIIVLHEGRVVEDGTHEELLAHGGVYAAMFNTQAEAYVN